MGRDFPYLWEVGFGEISHVTCAMVKTRLQTKMKEQEEEELNTLSRAVKYSAEEKSQGNEILVEKNPVEEKHTEEDISLEMDISEEESEAKCSQNLNNIGEEDFKRENQCEGGQELVQLTTLPGVSTPVSRTRLSKTEKRVSRQAHAALVALPKLLDHTLEDMAEEQDKDLSLEKL